MTIDISQFFQAFFDEAEELLAQMEKLLLAIDVSAHDPEELNAIFRTAHSIKGSAGTFNFVNISDLTHLLESLLDKMRKGLVSITTQHIDAFLATKDILKMQVNGHRHGAPVDQKAVADVQALLVSLLHDANAMQPVPLAVAADEGAVSVNRRFRIDLPKMKKARRTALEAGFGLLGKLFKAKAEAGRLAFTLDTAKTPDEIAAVCLFMLEPEDFAISEPTVENAPILVPAIDDQEGYGFFELLEPAGNAQEEQGYGFFDTVDSSTSGRPKDVATDSSGDGGGAGFFEALQQAAAEPASPTASPQAEAEGYRTVEPRQGMRRETDRLSENQESSIRVSVEKVDELMNLVGEMVITQAMIEQRAGTLDPIIHERLMSSIGQLTRNTRDLQDAVMSIRMMPMDFVFSRYPRMVRDLAGKLGKKVEFVTHGASTELDKGLIERIIDPLTHLIRNSIDHGIESPEIRTAAGKNEAGKLSLSARHQGGNIVIEVSDDGGGLSRQKILAQARRQDPSISDALPDAEVWDLIFAPGFSTAEKVTDISGRGVGLDVVKRNINAMGGNVELRSASGFGTTVLISLPLTLAILDGMSVMVGDEIYILPLGYVIESLQPAPETVKEIIGQGRVVKVHGEYLPLIPLYKIFGIEPRFTEPSQGIVVVIESDGKVAALFVDALVGQQQVVVKNLESNYRKVMGISGATILGDGNVSLIIDVAALIRSSRQLFDASTIS